MKRIILSVVVLSVVLAFAAFGANRPKPQPFVPAPSRFHHQPADAAEVHQAQWWRSFHDPLLDQLMERAERTNLDIRTAAARVAEARAARGGRRSTLLPSVDASGSASRLRGGFNQGVIRVPEAPGGAGSSFVTPFETNIVSGGLNLRWEADVFGGLRKGLRAADADRQAAEANLRDALVVVRAEIARNYIELRGVDEQIAIVESNVDMENELLDLVRARADAGLVSDLDVERQVAQLLTVRATLPDLDRQRLLAVHRIAVLTGDEPGALIHQLRRATGTLDVPSIPAAVPSDLLKRRPDIRRAEAQIAAAYARAGAARADLFPKFVITGLSGRQATEFAGLTVGAGNFFSIGPGISLPIFNAGRIRSNIAVQDARLEQSVRAYEAEVLAAFEETENAFVAVDRAELRRRELEGARSAATRGVELSRELYLRGLADFLTVLDSQRQRLQIERELAASQTAVLRGIANLHSALGE
jgi:NodT family efflux transporter outer membrane factor (OMF) lipoprotein